MKLGLSAVFTGQVLIALHVTLPPARRRTQEVNFSTVAAVFRSFHTTRF